MPIRQFQEHSFTTCSCRRMKKEQLLPKSSLQSLVLKSTLKSSYYTVAFTLDKVCICCRLPFWAIATLFSNQFEKEKKIILGTLTWLMLPKPFCTLLVSLSSPPSPPLPSSSSLFTFKNVKCKFSHLRRKIIRG